VSGLKYYFTIATAVEEDSGEEHMFDSAFVVKHGCSIKIMEAALESSSVEVAHREDFAWRGDSPRRGGLRRLGVPSMHHEDFIMERQRTTWRWTSAAWW
jgi:hypothetical protein